MSARLATGEGRVLGIRTFGARFDARHNSVGFLRWACALIVIFAHSGTLAGFYDGHNLGYGISTEQTVGGIAVGFFFFSSGLLLTRSRMGKTSFLRFFWRRALRVLPAFWVALLLVAFFFAPIAWRKDHGSLSGYWGATVESPFTYFTHNMGLFLGQRNVADMGDGTPMHQLTGAHDWNGSAWTLEYELKAYVFVAVLGFCALIGRRFSRWVNTVGAVTVIGLNLLMWNGVAWVPHLAHFFENSFNLMFLAPFSFGMIFAFWGHKIPMHGGLATAALAFGLYCYANGGWNMYGQYFFWYFTMYAGVALKPVRSWDRYIDFSYGVYIYAWPVMVFLTYFGIHEKGWFAYHASVVLIVHVMAFFSWNLIEKPAMSFKEWTPPLPAFLKTRSLPRPATPVVVPVVVVPVVVDGQSLRVEEVPSQ